MGIKEKSYDVRYWVWRLEFPDGDLMVKATPFIHDLQFELQNTIFRHNSAACSSILKKGEYSWMDSNKVKHTMRVENTMPETGRFRARPKVLGEL